jgi:SAM-dependent methyltransferase
MKSTTERFIPDEAHSPEEVVIGLLHLYAYHAAARMVSPGHRVLDVGFGEGYGSTILVSAGAEYVGLEVEAAAVEHARARYDGTFETYDGARIPAPDDSFDFVVSFQVIEHVDDPGPWVAEIRRVLREGGRALFTTPNRAHRLEDGERPWNRYHVREFATGELHDLLTRSFTDVHVYGVRGSDAIESIERSRVARARRLARLDPLGIRYLLPEGFDTRLRRALRRRGAAEISRSDLALEDLRHEEPADGGLDLLAVAG